MSTKGSPTEKLAAKVKAIEEEIESLAARNVEAEAAADGCVADDAAYQRATAEVTEVRSKLRAARERLERAKRALTQAEIAKLDVEMEPARSKWEEAANKVTALRGTIDARVLEIKNQAAQSVEEVQNELAEAERAEMTLRGKMSAIKERLDALVGMEASLQDASLC